MCVAAGTAQSRAHQSRRARCGPHFRVPHIHGRRTDSAAAGAVFEAGHGKSLVDRRFGRMTAAVRAMVKKTKGMEVRTPAQWAQAAPLARFYNVDSTGRGALEDQWVTTKASSKLAVSSVAHVEYARDTRSGRATRAQAFSLAALCRGRRDACEAEEDVDISAELDGAFEGSGWAGTAAVLMEVTAERFRQQQDDMGDSEGLTVQDKSHTQRSGALGAGARGAEASGEPVPSGLPYVLLPRVDNYQQMVQCRYCNVVLPEASVHQHPEDAHCSARRRAAAERAAPLQDAFRRGSGLGAGAQAISPREAEERVRLERVMVDGRWWEEGPGVELRAAAAAAAGGAVITARAAADGDTGDLMTAFLAQPPPAGRRAQRWTLYERMFMFGAYLAGHKSTALQWEQDVRRRMEKQGLPLPAATAAACSDEEEDEGTFLHWAAPAPSGVAVVGNGAEHVGWREVVAQNGQDEGVGSVDPLLPQPFWSSQMVLSAATRMPFWQGHRVPANSITAFISQRCKRPPAENAVYLADTEATRRTGQVDQSAEAKDARKEAKRLAQLATGLPRLLFCCCTALTDSFPRAYLELGRPRT